MRRQGSHEEAVVTTPETSSRMSRQASRNTSIEIALRSALHRMGFRFRVHRRPLPALRREADIVFTRTKVAVFVDGCYWHGCPEHGTLSRTNTEFWRHKIETNTARDRHTDLALAEAGWLSVRVWEHEPSHEAAERVAEAVRGRSG